MSDLKKQDIIAIGRLLLQDALCRNWYIVHIDDKANYQEKPKSKLHESGADVFETIKKFQKLTLEYLCEATEKSLPQNKKNDEIKAFVDIADEISEPLYDIIREEFKCDEPKNFSRGMIETIYQEGKVGSSPIYCGLLIVNGKERKVDFFS